MTNCQIQTWEWIDSLADFITDSRSKTDGFRRATMPAEKPARRVAGSPREEVGDRSGWRHPRFAERGR